MWKSSLRNQKSEIITLYTFQGPFANGTESSDYVQLMQQLSPPGYHIYMPLYQNDHIPRSKHPPPLPCILHRQRILNTRQCDQHGHDRLFCRKDKHFYSAMLSIYSRFERFSCTRAPVLYSSHTTSSTHDLLNGNTGAPSQPVSLTWGNPAATD